MSKINFPKKQEQRLIPKYLLEYAEELQENHPDPSASWGGGSGSDYTAGNGIDITENVISIDTEVVATKEDLPNMNNYYTKTGANNKFVSKSNLTDYSINEIIVGNSEIDNDNVDLRAVYSQDVKSEVSLDPTSTIIRTMSGTDTSTIGISATEIDVTTPMLKYNSKEVATKDELFSGDYNDLTNKPAIPTVNDPTITFTQGGVTKGTITLNQASNQTIALDAGGGGSTYTAGTWIDITNNTINVSNPYVSLLDSSNLPRVMISDHTNGTTPTFSNAKYCNISPLGFGINDRTNTNNNNYTYYKHDEIVYNGDYVLALPQKTGTLAVTSDIPVLPTLATVATTGSYNDLTNKPDLSIYELAADAFSGDYNDLTNKPTLFSGNYNDLTNKPDLSIYAQTANLGTAAFIDEDRLVIDYSQLTNTPTIPVVPTNVSAFTNDAGYITGITSGMVTTALGYTPGTSNFSGSYTDLTDKPTIPTATSDLNNDSGFITNSVNNLTNYTLSANLATVATSGSYNDLTNKPSIPTYTTLFNITPTNGTATYNINLTDDITKYDEIKIYYNDNDDTIRRFCSISPNPIVGNRITITTYLNTSTPRVYTKNTVFEIATTTSLTLVTSSQQRVGNNEAATVSVVTNQFHCRPYKIVGIKY